MTEKQNPETEGQTVASEPEYKIERPKAKLTKQQRIGMGALLAGASIAALWTVWPAQKAIPAVETSEAQEFQPTVLTGRFPLLRRGARARKPDSR